MPATKKDLLLLAADDRSAEKTAAAATLAWLADEVGADFDTYITTGQPFGAPASLAVTGDWHAEQLFFISNFYNVLYCGIGQSKTPQFRREVGAFGEILADEAPARLADFYAAVFGHYGRALPAEAVVIPAGEPPDGPPDEAPIWIEPFCYPEVFFRKALGVSSAAPDDQWRKLLESGVTKAYCLYCPPETAERLRALGIAVEVVDEVRPDDTYGSLTIRLADRWVDRYQTLAFGNQAIMLRSLGFFLRHRAMPLYVPVDGRFYIKTVSAYAEMVGGDRVVWGNQTVYKGGDSVITEFGKYDLSMSLGISVVGPTIREKIKLPPDWIAEAKAPWEEEYLDEFLEAAVAKGMIPVCYLLYAADLGHLSSFARLFDILSTDSTRCGLGFPSTWYDFSAETLEQLYIPYQQGGVFPRCEPLVSSTGLAVGTEASGYMKRETLIAQLSKAIDSIKTHCGDKMAPLGYYPWEDACPYYHHQEAEPQFDVPKEVGFDYCVTYKDEGQFPKIVHQDGDFICINQQNVHWWGDGPVLKTQEWERKVVESGRSGWIMVGLDSPFWCQPPFYYDPEYPTFCKEETSVVELTAAMRYVNTGGESGRLFLAKPHEVVRYARLLSKKGLI